MEVNWAPRSVTKTVGTPYLASQTSNHQNYHLCSGGREWDRLKPPGMVVNHRQEMIFPSGGGNRTDEIDVDYPERSGGSGHADDWQPDVVDDLRMLTGLTGVTETGYVAVHTTPDKLCPDQSAESVHTRVCNIMKGVKGFGAH